MRGKKPKFPMHTPTFFFLILLYNCSKRKKDVIKMTEQKTAEKKPRAKELFVAAQLVFKCVFLAVLGFIMSVAKLPLDIYPLGIGAVCAAADYPAAVLLGVIVGSAFFDTRIYVLASALSCLIRIMLAVLREPKRFFSDGLRVYDGMGARISAALVGGGAAAIANYIIAPSYDAVLSGVLCVCLAISSAAAFSFFLDKAYKYTALFPIGVIFITVCVTLAVRGIEIFGVDVSAAFACVSTLLAAFMWGGAYGGVAGLLSGLVLGGEWAAILALVGCAAGFFGLLGAFAAQVTSMAIYVGGVLYAFGSAGFYENLIPLIIGEALTAVPAAMGMIRRKKTPDGERRVGQVINELKEGENKKRMEMLSQAMRSLSEFIGGIKEKFRKKKNISFESMCRSVWNEHCKDCPVDCKCHDIGSIPGDDAIENLAYKLMSSGRVDREKIGEYIASKCPKTEQIISDINDGAARLVDMMTGDEQIDILSLDYEASAHMIGDALAQSGGKYEPDRILSEKLRRELLRRGFATENLVVCGDRRTFVIATGDEILRARIGAEDIRKICEDVCKKRFLPPTFKIEVGHAAMILEADTGYIVECSCRQTTKRGEDVSGDSVASLYNRDGYFYSFICDGMGSGQIAAATSKISCVFLEKMLGCGNAKQTTLEMLNTFIRNKGVECYATVDLLEIDLMQGTASFVKSGATPSYVRRGGSIFKIESSTFPIGITREFCAEMTEFDLKNGDVIILCSDGVAQDFDVSASLDPSWFVEFIEREWTDDLDEMAEKIITAAATQNHNSDDMTITLLRVLKKADAIKSKAKPKPKLKAAE